MGVLDSRRRTNRKHEEGTLWKKKILPHKEILLQPSPEKSYQERKSTVDRPRSVLRLCYVLEKTYRRTSPSNLYNISHRELYKNGRQKIYFENLIILITIPVFP